MSKWWAIIIGAGMAISPIHNRFLTDTATIDGNTLVFLPAIGYLLMIMGVGMFCSRHWAKIKEVGLGDKKWFIPLIAILFAILISGFTADNIKDGVAPGFAALAFFGLYMVTRVLGKQIFLPLAIGAYIASIGVIAYALINPGQVSGGYVFLQNYDIVVGYVLLGTALFYNKRQWILAYFAFLAMFMSGSPEGVFVVGVMGLAILIRRDWSRKLLYTIVPILGVALMFFVAGYAQELYDYVCKIALNQPTLGDIVADTEVSAIQYRINVIVLAFKEFQPLGTGYVLTAFREGIVHNVPLIIVQQLGIPGIFAALAWLWIVFYGITKTNYKYVFILLFALSVFDHFVWTQMAPVFWAVAGLASAYDIKSDKIYKENNYEFSIRQQG